MYCPACGVKNEEGVVKCFICGKVMPGAFESAPEPKRASPSQRPTRIPVADPTAALGDRMIAIVLDGVLLFVVIGSLVAFGAQKWELIPQSPGSITPAEFTAAGSFAAIVGILYFWLCEGLTGATLGKALAGIRVRSVDGDAASLREALVRTLFRLIDGLGFYFVGFVVAIFSRQRRRIGDHAAGTVVVNEPPSAAARAGALVLWIVLIAGALFGVWNVVDPARAWVETTLLDRPAAATAERVKEPPRTELALDRFAWLDSPQGPVVETAAFKPGDRQWARYAIDGFGRAESGGINLITESSAYDPAGLQIARPVVSATLELAPETHLERVDSLEIPSWAPRGTYELRIRVRDLSREREATFVQPFDVDAPEVAPAAALVVRNFRFAIARDGFALDTPVFDVGETVHYRYEIHGLTFADDRIDMTASYRFTGPDGRVIFSKAKWSAVQESYRYHPPTFFAVQNGTVSLPSDALPGLYTVEHVITDKVAGATTTGTGQFRLR